jgi:hypothetical protein
MSNKLMNSVVGKMKRNNKAAKRAVKGLRAAKGRDGNGIPKAHHHIYHQKATP